MGARRAIVLGLDLQGGSHVLLEVDSNSVVKALVDNLRDAVRRVLREEKVAITGGIGVLPRGVQLRIPIQPNGRGSCRNSSNWRRPLQRHYR